MIDILRTNLEKLPRDFFSISPKDLIHIFPRPTVIHLKGESPKALYLSTLLHGNESSGIHILQKYLSQVKKLPRDLILFIGNVSAAAENKRVLPHQEDYNRVWEFGESLEHLMAEKVCHFLFSHRGGILAAIDIHNNSGENPLYACINKIHTEDLKIAQLFSDQCVFFLKPSEVQSVALSQHFPSVTLECGVSGNLRGIEKGTELIHSMMNMKSWDDLPTINENTFELFQSTSKIKLKKGFTLSFDKTDERASAHVCENIESYNFELLKKGSTLLSSKSKEFVLEARNDADQDVTQEYFSMLNNNLVVKKDFIPAMLTKNTEIIEQDCFAYIMEKRPLKLSQLTPRTKP